MIFLTEDNNETSENQEVEEVDRVEEVISTMPDEEPMTPQYQQPGNFFILDSTEFIYQQEAEDTLAQVASHHLAPQIVFRPHFKQKLTLLSHHRRSNS